MEKYNLLINLLIIIKSKNKNKYIFVRFTQRPNHFERWMTYSLLFIKRQSFGLKLYISSARHQSPNIYALRRNLQESRRLCVRECKQRHQLHIPWVGYNVQYDIATKFCQTCLNLYGKCAFSVYMSFKDYREKPREPLRLPRRIIITVIKYIRPFLLKHQKNFSLFAYNRFFSLLILRRTGRRF